MACQQNGIRIALASARPAPGLFLDRDRLQLDRYHGILMSYNGGCIIDAANGSVLHKTSMDMEETRSLLKLLEKFDVTVILDDGKQFYVTDPDGYKVQYEAKNNNMVFTVVPDLAEFLHFSPVKLLLSARPEQLEDIRSRIVPCLPESLTTFKTAPFYFEIIPRSINKGQGLLAVCRALGIDPVQTMAFGDSENDIPMIRSAGIGVAMGNAEEAVKNAADFVTLSNNEDGIAEAIRVFCL